MIAEKLLPLKKIKPLEDTFQILDFSICGQSADH